MVRCVNTFSTHTHTHTHTNTYTPLPQHLWAAPWGNSFTLRRAVKRTPRKKGPLCAINIWANEQAERLRLLHSNTSAHTERTVMTWLSISSAARLLKDTPRKGWNRLWERCFCYRFDIWWSCHNHRDYSLFLVTLNQQHRRGKHIEKDPQLRALSHCCVWHIFTRTRTSRDTVFAMKTGWLNTQLRYHALSDAVHLEFVQL